MKYSRNLLFIGFLFIFISAGFSQMTLPSLIGDNMVLQRNTQVPLWGWSTPGKKIAIQTDWDGQDYKTQTDDQGKWLIELNTPDAGGPYTITIQGKSQIQLKNILISGKLAERITLSDPVIG